MNKILLAQALKFKNSVPTNNQIKNLTGLAIQYQNDNEVYFLSIKHRQKPQILDENMFFRFLSHEINQEIKNFEDIEYLLEDVESRKESIEKSGNSKEYYAKVFDRVVVFQKHNEPPVLYKNIDDIPHITNQKILAVENGENFLNIYKSMWQFGFEQFVYLSGYPNSLTKQFLRDKDVVFFLDYDIEAIKIYDSIKCNTKEFFKYPDIEKYFSTPKYLNQSLYKKQRTKLPKEHDELQWLIDLIKQHSGVIEQEILI